MNHLRNAVLLIALLLSTLACSLTGAAATPTVTVQASPMILPTNPPQPTAAIQPSDTPAPTQMASPSDTPDASSGSLPIPFANLSNVSQYFNPVGQPASTWNGIPIMPEATAGQEFKAGAVYSFKATATIAQAASFYEAKLPALGFASFMAGPSTGSAGTGSNAIHDSFLYFMKGSQILLIYIASYDSDLAHASVVISTQ